MTEPENKSKPWAIAFWLVVFAALGAPFVIALWKWVLSW